MGAARMFGAVHPEGTRRFRHSRADTRLRVVHAAPGYLVVLRMIAAGVVEHRRGGRGSVQADTRPPRDGLPHRRWQFRGVGHVLRRHGARAGAHRARRGPDPRSEVRPNFWRGRTYRPSGRRNYPRVF